MKKFAFFFAALCACLISCNKEISDPQNDVTTPEVAMQTVTITATINDDVTKTSYAGGTTFSWTAGDEISVLCSDNVFRTFTANSTGTTTTFSGTLPSEVSLGDYAFFPADAGHLREGLKFSLPESKDLTGHPSADMPMVGDKGDKNTYSFMHCSGASKFTLTNIPSSIVAVEVSFVSASLKLSGLFGVFKSAGEWRWNADGGSTTSEKTFTRKVSVVNHTAEVYLPYAWGTNMWANNTVTVKGYDSSANEYAIFTGLTMKGTSDYNYVRAHVQPLTPLGMNQLGFIDWTAVSIPTFAGNGTGNNYGERIIQWKAFKDSYYLYFWYKILKEKIKFGTTSYDDSQSRFYIGLDLDNNATTGSTDSWAGNPSDGWEARIEVRPWSGTVNGSPEIAAGTNSNSWIERPVDTTLGAKVSQCGSFDATYAYLQISIPLSALGDMGSTINVRHAMQWAYYTSLESVSF